MARGKTMNENRKRRRRRDETEEDEDEEEEEELNCKRKRSSVAASKFFELEAEVDSDDDDEEEIESEDDFIDDTSVEKERSSFRRRDHHVHVHPQVNNDDDDVDEVVRRIEQKCGRKSRHEDDDEETEETEEEAKESQLPTRKNSKLWQVNCPVNHQKEVTRCLIQKKNNKSLNLRIKSVIRVKNNVYVEADEISHVREACKGVDHAFVNDEIVFVRKEKMSRVLRVKRGEETFIKGSWVRITTGIYKGDLAQIVDVNHMPPRVTVKLIPRINFDALVNECEGRTGRGISSRETEILRPPAKFWNASKAKALNIPVKQHQRDPITGDYFDVLDDMQFKDGYLYKTMSVESVTSKIQQPALETSSEVSLCPQPRNSMVYRRRPRPRPDPLVSTRIRIRKGPYHGMAATVVEVKGNKLWVELEAQMKIIYIDRDQIIENNAKKVNFQDNEYGVSYARTPLRPWMTPTRDRSTAAATPIHEGMRTPIRNRAWNPCY